jgi:quercetin dioxygenase-like cupin family protein
MPVTRFGRENNMRTRTIGLTATILAAALAASPAQALDATARPPVVVTPLASTTVTAAGQPIVLPQTDARVIASLFEIATGATLPVHKHPSMRYAYVLEGELLVTNVETGAGTTYRAGEFIVEMLDTWHQGTAVGPDTVRLVVIDQVEGDVPNTLLRARTP